MTAPQENTWRTEIVKKHHDLVALVDADRIKHLVCNDVWKLLQQNYPHNEIDIKYLVDERLENIHSQFSAKAIIWCFSGKSYETFRNAVCFEKEYKGNRKEDPRYYDFKMDDMLQIVKYIMSFNHTLIFSELEADDLLCMLQNEKTFIYSNDKDLVQIPGLHFDENKLDIYNVSEEQAMKNLCMQLLTGDSTDFITGIFGVGKETAEKILDGISPQAMIPTVLYEYQKRFGITAGTDMFTETWNLVKLRLCRGTHFLQKFTRAFTLRDFLISQ